MRRKTVRVETAERCWELLCADGLMRPRIEKVVATVAASRSHEAVEAFCRILYVAGFERGFAVGAEVGPEPEREPERAGEPCCGEFGTGSGEHGELCEMYTEED